MAAHLLKKRTFYGRSQVLASQVQSRPTRPKNNEEVSKAKAMWQAGDVTKPEYVRFCNQIHLIDLQANKGDKDGDEARKAKQDLVAELVGSKAAN